MNKDFYNEIVNELNTFLREQENRFPKKDVLKIDLHCHDHNSNVPDELLGRILGVPETWLETEDLLKILKEHKCDAFTVTNHNNARSCFKMMERGIDILPGAEFSCHVPDFKIGIHVLAYGFTPAQEDQLNRLRSDIYKFQEYTYEKDIPTIWAHPLYHYRSKGDVPMEFFDTMALLFERFEVINGQRDTWQNMLVKNWILSLNEERINSYVKRTGIPADRFCKDKYKKSFAGGSDSHMGIFTGLTGTYVYVDNLAEKVKNISASQLTLDAIKRGDMAPYGSHNDSEKMTVSFLDYFCQIALHMKDPGLIRMLLHKGDLNDKLLALFINNGFAELNQHKVTMDFLKLFHDCFMGSVPSFGRRFFVPKHYKAIFDEATHIAETRRDNPEEMVDRFKDSIHFIYDNLNQLLVKRLTDKLESLDSELKDVDIIDLFDSIELPSYVRRYLGSSSLKKNYNDNDKENMIYKSINLKNFFDGLSFPFLASAVILSASFASTKVMYNSRPLLNQFSHRIGRLKHPERMLWLTDTLEDVNGVAMVIESMLKEIQKRDLPIDILVCSSKLVTKDHLIVIPPLAEIKLPFYQDQPVRVPNILEIHKIFKDGEYDRLMCSTEGPMGIVSLFLKHAYSVPAYFYVHTDWMMFARKVLNFNHQNRSMLRRLLRAFYHDFDGLFVLNKDQRKWLTGKDMGLDPSKVFLTAHWAEDIFSPKKIKKTEIFGLKNNETVLLFAGRVSDEKGVMELPSIYKRIKESFPDVKIAIAGKGPAEMKLKKDLPEGIYLGWVDHNKLPEVYSAADILLLPSKFDTFGCVVLEAMSCGLPVVAYKTKGPKDIIEHEKNGYLVDTKTEMVNAIHAFLSNEKLKKQFSKAALERAEAYNPDIIITELFDRVELPIKKVS